MNGIEKDKSEEYSVFLRHLQAEQVEKSKQARIFFMTVVFCFLAVLGCLIFTSNADRVKRVFGEDSQITKILLKYSIPKHKKKKAQFLVPFMPRRQNILLLGVDSNGLDADLWKGTRTDTIILLNIDPRTKSVNAISIPRDSKVYLPDNHGIQKINSAHAIGGVEMTIRTIEDTLGVKIDRYFMVHDNAVRKIVDVIEGVPVYVEKNMFYNDNSGNLHINLSKGLNVLNGTEAVGYLRYRKDGLGDIGRTQRQQWFLKGLLEKLQTPETIAKIPDLLNVISTYTKTNMSLYELSQYAAMTKLFDINKIQVATLPGSPNKKGHISYWILDPEKTQEVINRMVYRDKPQEVDRTLNAGVVYSTQKTQEAAEMKSMLEELGYNVTCYYTTGKTHSKFMAQSEVISTDFYSWLKQKAPQLQNAQFVYDPLNTYCTKADFTIILSDY